MGIEVLNAGVCSYSPCIHWRKIKHLLEDEHLVFDELVVFLDMSDVYNEVEDYDVDPAGNVVARHSDRTIPALRQKEADSTRKMRQWITGALRRNSILLPAGRRLFCHLVFGGDWCRFHDTVNLRSWSLEARSNPEAGKEGLALMAKYMDKLKALLDSRAIRLTVAVYPWAPEIFHGDRDSPQVLFWQRWCSERQVDLIDYFPYFVKTGTERERYAWLAENCLPDGHWNSQGHKLVADVFLKYYKERPSGMRGEGRGLAALDPKARQASAGAQEKR